MEEQSEQAIALSQMVPVPKLESRIDLGRFKILPGFPIAIYNEIRPILKKWEWLLPNWLNYCYVEYGEKGDDDTIADIAADYSYRFATMKIYDCFSHCQIDSREPAIVHEIVHCLTTPLAQTIKKYCVRQNKYVNFVYDMMLANDEMIVEDISKKFLELESKILELELKILESKILEKKSKRKKD